MLSTASASLQKGIILNAETIISDSVKNAGYDIRAALAL
jgi:hypothetical protein